MNSLQEIKSILFGVAVGDALGVPVEFKSREHISRNPVTDMIGFGTYPLPPGTFSDDSSLTFCLAEALTVDFNLDLIANNFIKWSRNNYWTATGKVFDIGIATDQAIEKLISGVPPELAGGSDEYSNGNGSLMRIAPLIFYLSDKPVLERFEITQKVSSITHGHIRSVIACFYYLEYLRYMKLGLDKFQIYEVLQDEIPAILTEISVSHSEIALFDRLLRGEIHSLKKDEINSRGYVIHALEAAVWCLLTSDNYKDTVLKAVNLGEDTDTTAAVAGGLAGLLYGFDSIPLEWRLKLARKDDIEDLAERMHLGMK